MSFVGTQLDQFEKHPARKSPSWLEPARRAAIGRFVELGLPTVHDEQWRFTSVAPIERIPFRLATNGTAVARASEALQAAALEQASFGVEGGFRAVFLNGRFVPELSTARAVPNGARLCSLGGALATERKLMEAHLGRYASYEKQAFTALNTAFMEDGAFLTIPDGLIIQEPILFVFLSTSGGEPTLWHPRNLVVAGARSQATIIESYAGTGGDAYFANAVTEIVAGDGSVIEHYKLQREADGAFHIATVQARLGAGSVFSSHSVSLGGGLVRNDINAVLDGEGADCTLNGLYMTTGTQHIDNHTTIDHAKPHGTSREVYKGILDGKSRGVFDGKIVVRQDAQKT
ncbi:MAG: SufB/SufD family protein, partial [Vicinamibacteria bacterium]